MGITFWVCKWFDAEEPCAKTLKEIDLATDTDPGQWTELLDNWCRPRTFSDERERVVIVHVSHGLWGWDFWGGGCVIGCESYVGPLFLFLSSLL